MHVDGYLYFLFCHAIFEHGAALRCCRGVAKLNETDGGRQRFILELEFVQLLANPTYIHCVFSLLPPLAFFFQLLCNFCILLAVQIIYPALSA
jgi:hypothetical protein